MPVSSGPCRGGVPYPPDLWRKSDGGGNAVALFVGPSGVEHNRVTAQRNQTGTNRGRIASAKRFLLRSILPMAMFESRPLHVESIDSDGRVDRFRGRIGVKRFSWEDSTRNMVNE